MPECLHEDLLLGRQQLLELDLEGLVVAELNIALVPHLATCIKWAEGLRVDIVLAPEVETVARVDLRGMHGQRLANSVPPNRKPCVL